MSDEAIFVPDKPTRATQPPRKGDNSVDNSRLLSTRLATPPGRAERMTWRDWLLWLVTLGLLLFVACPLASWLVSH